MADIEHLESERLKMWERIEAIEVALSKASSDGENQLKQATDSLGAHIETLADSLSKTEALAKSKATEDGQTALHAAQEAVKGRDEARVAAQEAQEAKHVVEDIKATVEKYSSLSNNAESLLNDIKALEAQIKDAKEKDAAAQAAWASINQQKQNVATLNEQVSTHAAKIESLKQEIAAYKIGIDELKNKADSELSSKREALDSLLQVKQASLESLTKEIEKLIPGAISAGLAASYRKRSTGQLILKVVWGLLLVLTVIMVILQTKDLITPFLAEGSHEIEVTKQLSVFVISCRFVILGAMVLLEEFFRRNFNIASRLEEAYAYKAVMLSTYHAYSEELKEINMPPKDGNRSAVSVLAGIVLEKLQEEPGKEVFDKEKHEIGAGALFDRLMPEKGESVPEKVVNSLTSGEFLSKITWQAVVMVTILSATLCGLAIIILKLKAV